MALPLDLARRIQSARPGEAWKTILDYAWSVCAEPITIDSPTKEVMRRERELYPLDLYLATAGYDLWPQMESCAPRNTKALASWWSQGGPDVIIRDTTILGRSLVTQGGLAVRVFFAAILISVISCCAFGQTYTINTFAGNGTIGYSGDNGPATSATLSEPDGIAVDSSNDIYIADSSNAVVRKVTPGGIISTVAGGGSAATTGGPATGFSLDYPVCVAIDSSGNLYISDTNWGDVFKVTPSGTITIFAGNSTTGFSGDGGLATSASLSWASGVATDSSGNVYIGDYNNYRLRVVNAAGTISTIAGSGTGSFGNGGPATSAGVNWPTGVALDSSGNLYVAETAGMMIRKVTPGGTISTAAGAGTAGYTGDGGAATAAQLKNPQGVAVDSSGNLYLADTSNNVIRKVTAAGTISTVAGTGAAGFSGDGGAATGARLNQPGSVAVDSAGNLYIADSVNYRIRKVTTDGRISTIAGNGSRAYSGDGGPATSASIS